MLRSIFWKPYSRLFIVGDNSGWSTDIDAKDTAWFATKLGIKAQVIKRMYFNLPQAVHYTSQFSLLLPIYKSKNRLSVDYFHGRPEQQESFRKCFEAIREHHEQFGRIRVSNSEMEKLIKTTGIDPKKVMRIPIGIDLNIFKPQEENQKQEARRKLGVPLDAVVIGSFQKDGVGKFDGTDEGNEPKLIKGPDIFLEVVRNLKLEINNLFVLLSGPARGYIKKGLEDLGIPYKHVYFNDYREIAGLYDAIDLYLITSREEGGPKACLESMAKGVPLVTTRVGQCADLVLHRENAMMAEIDDVGSLSQHALQAIRDEDLRQKLINGGFKTASENSHEAQLPLWREYLKPLFTP